MIRAKSISRERLLSDNDNIIVFPTNRIQNKDAVGKTPDEREHKKLVDKQTREFVEGNVDQLAYQLLDKFVNMGIRTNQISFTADLALVIDSIRGLIYRDFGKKHPAQLLSEKMVKVNLNGSNKTAKINYNEVLNINHKEHKPFSRDVEDEIRDLSDMADIQFTPDFDPDNDNK